MKKIRKTVRQLYVRPTIDVFCVASEGCLLAGSPAVRPGGGGTPPLQGGVHVIDANEENGGDDDNLEG